MNISGKYGSKYKRICCLMLTAVVCLSLLCGCGKQNENPGFVSESAESGDTLPDSAECDETLPDSAECDETLPDCAESDDTVSDSATWDEVIEVDQSDDEETDTTITIIMVGDILLHTPVEEAACSDVDGTYDFTHIFDNTKNLISGADLALVNQEVIIGGEELGVSGYPAFNAPDEIGDALYAAGFDVVLHATNHAMDKGRKGITNCLEFWNSKYPQMNVLGIHNSTEDRDEVTILDIEGIKVAILNYTYGTNGIPLPDDMPYAVDLLNEQAVLEDIAYAKDNSDFLIVAPHWGTEYRLEPDSYQKKWTDLFLKNGVDLVIGTHPHVIEPVEMIHNDENGNDMLVYYSLGNFVNWTSGTGDGVANRMVGGMAEVNITKQSDGQSDSLTYISDYDIIPLVTDLHPGDNGVTVYPLSAYNEDMASENEIIKQDSAFSYDYCLDLCNKVWGNLQK